LSFVGLTPDFAGLNFAVVVVAAVVEHQNANFDYNFICLHVQNS